MTRTLSLFALLFAFACNGDKASGTGDTAGTVDTNVTGDDDDTTAQPHVDSCNFDLGFCDEFTDFASTEEVCNGFDSGTETTTLPATYTDGACPSGSVFICDLPGVGGGAAASEPVVVYYYDSFPGDPADACDTLGGTPH